MIIAVDGPAASGKGTLARRLAAHFGYAYLDTGKIYRAVGYRVLEAGGDPEDPDAALAAARALQPEDLENPELTSDRAAVAASKVAAMEPVRAVLLGFQQGFAADPPDGAPGAVLDGRDIGTVVCPEAPSKLFVTADVEERAKRRHKELLDKGEPSIYSRVLQALKDRDARDSNRSAAPLVAAPDAIVIDTTAMDPDEAFASALDSIR
ncbi:MAG: (d)CMP kinase [Rhodospirillaceae bacterium]|nr:(d)CMP kinase [Rhodospirillaceae bacterium]MDD9927491.1 (d)CMP kinase [Rhodospirillaceae bacterium]